MDGSARQGRIRVAIVDDHPMMREGTRLALQQMADIEVVGIAEDGASALDLVRQLCPDVLVLDVRLPDMSGIEVAERVRSEQPRVGILVLTGYEDVGYFHALVRLGVHGYLRKSASADQIANAVRTVGNGNSALELGELPMPLPGGKEALTAREYEVLRLLVAGRRNGDIADMLSLSLKTVEFHVSHILQKLGARSRAQAVSMALEQRLVLPT
jgi:DNA-binding NarL/FixJ family response regulator